jgi:hypothetical protein
MQTLQQLVSITILIACSFGLGQATKPHDLRTSTPPPPIQQQAPKHEGFTPEELHTIKQSQNFKHLECLQDLSIQDKTTCPKPSNKF